ncbi:hypothetical protein EJB05_12125, partial [Eragrostis curvula]
MGLEQYPWAVLGQPAGPLAGMSHQSDSSPGSDDSKDSSTINPTGIYTMEEFVVEQSVKAAESSGAVSAEVK